MYGNSSGARRLDDAEDFVRAEIEFAIEQGKLIIPVLLGSARMPHVDELPAELKSLVRRQAVWLTHQRFRSDVGMLIKVLEDALQGADGRRKLQTQLRGREHSLLGQEGTDAALNAERNASKSAKIVISYRRTKTRKVRQERFSRDWSENLGQTLYSWM